jgi:hypothetical protein
VGTSDELVLIHLTELASCCDLSHTPTPPPHPTALHSFNLLTYTSPVWPTVRAYVPSCQMSAGNKNSKKSNAVDDFAEPDEVELEMMRVVRVSRSPPQRAKPRLSLSLSSAIPTQ